MSTQPEAIRLADALDRWHEGVFPVEAAAELRRLHAVNAEMLKALKYIDKECNKDGRKHWSEAVKARAAIKKAEGV